MSTMKNTAKTSIRQSTWSKNRAAFFEVPVDTLLDDYNLIFEEADQGDSNEAWG